ncbi:hypothetical protein HA075_05105 [bacterium BFN5]|nr:hypothetical protein HA075_04855 [bacterium BFN5]QJW45276.1 hypothetical protein HA075_05105 [bacterium BFN5]
MKKSICLLNLVTMLVISSTSVLAAPQQSSFSDVPAKHWAYDAITKLAQDGIINGYADGTFRGDRTMTRYEIAEIVANAMTKEEKANAEDKALINKLAAEFNSELTKLDAKVNKVDQRVTKLEDKISFSGSDTVRWVKWDNATAPGFTHFKNGVTQNNFMLMAAAKVNENISANFKWYVLRQESFGNPAQTTTSPNSNEPNNLVQGELSIRNFLGQAETTLTGGRMVQSFGSSGFIAALQGIDGVKLGFGKQVKVEIGAADFSNPVSNYQKSYSDVPSAPAANADYGALYFKDAAWIKASYNTSKATAVQGFALKNTSGPSVANLYGVGLSTMAMPKLLFRADYVKNTEFDVDNTNVQYRLSYRGAAMNQPGSWGAHLDYGKAFARASLGWGDYNATALFPKAGVESWNVTLEDTLTKNVMLKMAQSINSKNPVTGAKSAFGEWSRVQVEFLF